MEDKKTVLAVDDHEKTLELYAYIITNMGHKIITAKDGNEAIEQYKKIRPNFVLMDMRMPNLSGIDALKEIRDIDSNAKVVMITGYNVTDDEKTRCADALTILEKPFDYRKLKEVITKYI